MYWRAHKTVTLTSFQHTVLSPQTFISCLDLWKMCVVDFNDNNRPPAIKGFKCQEHNLCGFEKRDYLRTILMQQH